jgi:hypothetical protein
MKYFGSQIGEAINILAARHSMATLGSSKEADDRVKLAQQFTRLVMQVIVTIIVLAGCFAVILKSSDQTATKAAYGLLGVVVGYWLK